MALPMVLLMARPMALVGDRHAPRFMAALSLGPFHSMGRTEYAGDLSGVPPGIPNDLMNWPTHYRPSLTVMTVLLERAAARPWRADASHRALRAQQAGGVPGR